MKTEMCIPDKQLLVETGMLETRSCVFGKTKLVAVIARPLTTALKDSSSTCESLTLAFRKQR